MTDEQVQRNLEKNVFALSDKRAQEALKLQETQDKILKSQADFLIKYVGQENLIGASSSKEGSQKPQHLTSLLRGRPGCMKR